jgi:hypothetical protein
MVGEDDESGVFYTDAGPVEEWQPAPPADEWEAARRALVDELLTRYRALTADAIRAVTWPEQRRDYRAGNHNDLMVAVFRLQSEYDRYVPHPSESDEAHLSTPASVLFDGAHAVIVADLLSRADFVFLTAPLSALLGVDLAARHAGLRPPGTPEAGPIGPYATPVTDPLPDHALWSHTRALLTRRMSEIAERDGPGVYVVDLHLDVEWWGEDIRQAGIEIRWNTDSSLTERRRAWHSTPERLANNPDAADELPWDWVWFRGSDGEMALWRPSEDPHGNELLGDYARELGLWYSDAELEDGDEDEIIDKQVLLGEYLQAGLPTVVRAMHHTGDIARIFGRPIPITFSAQDSHAPAWEWARAANPPELYALFGPTQERSWSPG